MWYYEEQGSGRPLVLLHGIGMSGAAWRPVMPLLAQKRRALVFDIAGFGETPPLAGGVKPTIPNLVDALVDTLTQMGVDLPVDMAGNSQGGYMALEAARRGVARSVVAISPAGLWEAHTAASARLLLHALYLMSRAMPLGVTRALMRFAPLRELFLMFPVSPGSGRMPASDAIRVSEDLAKATAFVETFSCTEPFTGGQSITVPLTVAFGGRDWVLPSSCRRRDKLPEHTQWVYPPRWGHVPMWVDPAGVASLILEGTR